MTGSLAETIMGEAGPDPAAQFAVAATIANRQKAGSFPGGSNPTAIVNAPQQYVGFNPSPNDSARALAAAIESGTLDQFGTVGNAVNFQSGATAAANGLTAGTNIGGNWFSDRFGAPTGNFQPPVFGGQGGVLAGAQGGAVLPTSGGTSSTSTATSSGAPGSGQSVNLGLQKTTLDSIQGWINGIAKGVWDSVWKTVGGTLLDFQNWFMRAFVIIVGIVILAIALIKLSGHNVSDVIVAGGKAAALA